MAASNGRSEAERQAGTSAARARDVSADAICERGGRAAAGKPVSRFGHVSGQWEDGAVGTGMSREGL